MTRKKTSDPAAASAAAKKNISLPRKILFALLATVLFFVVLELVLRIVGFSYDPRRRKLWKPTVAGFEGTREFYINTDFAPPGYIWVSQPYTPYTDRYGFRKPGVPMEKAPGKIRVAFLGGSTTQGGYRPYPERAIRLLNRAMATNRYEMLNVACSSYSTHQSKIALERWVLPRDPDVVVIFHGWNDRGVMQDGFSDHEKDVLLRLHSAEAGNGNIQKIRHLRTAQAVGWLIDKLDVSWPRARVNPRQFEKNMREILEQCREKDIPVIVIIRPEMLDPDKELSGIVAQHARETFGIDSFGDLYKTNYTLYTDIQRRMADEYDHAKACEADVLLRDIQRRNRTNAYGPGLQVFRQDACHLYEFGEQKMAELVAASIAPEHANAVSQAVHTVEYNLALAEEMRSEALPFEAYYYAGEALALNPTDEQAQHLQKIREQAQQDFEFIQWFREGRWGGSDTDFDSKISKLRKCLQMKPDDYGVCLQLFRVCYYSGKPQLAAAAMNGFQPAGQQDRFAYLNLLFQSHLHGQRWQQAAQTAQELLSINPNHAEARAFLQQIQGR